MVLSLYAILSLRTRVLGWWIEQWREPLLPAGLMGITASRDVRLDATLLTRYQGGGAKYPASSAAASGMSIAEGIAARGRFGFLRVVEVKQSHAVYHEAGQMVGRQTVAQPHCQIERLGIVHLFEGSTHAGELLQAHLRNSLSLFALLDQKYF